MAAGKAAVALSIFGAAPLSRLSAVVLAGLVGTAEAQEAGDVLPTSRARIFAKPSGEVWKAARLVAKDLGLATSHDDAHQTIDSWWQPFLRSGPGNFTVLARPPGKRDFFADVSPALQLHVFVSPFAQPARVYVDSIVAEGTTAKGAVKLIYGSAEVSAWFFRMLEERVAEKGRPMPKDPVERGRLAHKLGGPPPCDAVLGPAGGGNAGVARPRMISRPDPVYPLEDRKQRREAVITVEAALAEDGAVHSVVAEVRPDQEEMATSAKHAVTMGRYEPARAQGCAVPSVIEVPVSFKVR